MFELKKQASTQFELYMNDKKIAHFTQVSRKTEQTAWHFTGKTLYIADFACHTKNTDSVLRGLKASLAGLYDCIRFENASHIALWEHCFQDNGVWMAEQRLHDNCPLSPVLMQASYRHGKQTPWGGSKLRTLFQKNIPDDVTGESLEVSTIKDLESKDTHGMQLSAMIKAYGRGFVGYEFADNTAFPLLLKFLDAKGLLSIQVHPDDAYAHKHENGKLGKEEAWVVLDCEDKAQIVYGLHDRVCPADLSACLHSGQSPEHLVQFVSVKKGDIFYIPPGTVHALGSGIVVYEIQQSSDVTYRMWDWGRMDAQGNPRELHIEHSLACIEYDKVLSVSQVPLATGKHKIVDAESFMLCAVNINNEEHLENEGNAFLLLTALDPMEIRVYDDAWLLDAGQSVFIPANLSRVDLYGTGRALVSKPKKKHLETT